MYEFSLKTHIVSKPNHKDFLRFFRVFLCCFVVPVPVLRLKPRNNTKRHKSDLNVL